MKSNEMRNVAFRLPAEWEEQEGVMLTWPHEGTDWVSILDEVTDTYCRMAREIAAREELYIVCHDEAKVRSALAPHLDAEMLRRVHLFACPTDDTWARDHGFISLVDDRGRRRLLDFRFNGWGQKFPSANDNMICRRLAERQAIEGDYECHLDLVLEGGSIESDGRGTLLTNTQCLLSVNRNEPISISGIEFQLKHHLCISRVLWLHHGYLEGDDTDSHIDTLARLCPGDAIAYVRCTDESDPHHHELSLMEAELEGLRPAGGEPYRLIPLPMARPAYAADGHRLPATYANFLPINGAVLVPTYGTDLDDAALQAVGLAFPDREVVGIDCRVLIEQHGSLHCCTMQLPRIRG